MLNAHGITSARYASEDKSEGAPVKVMRHGREENRRANDDVEGGGVAAYLAGGGTIDPYIPPEPTPPTADEIKAECGRRIYAVASQAAQTNMAAARAAGVLTEEQNAAFLSGLQWIAAMRGAAGKLVAASDATYKNDSHWPACPQAVIDLADAF